MSARYVTNPMMELALSVTTYTRSGGRRQSTISRQEQPGVFDVVADAARSPRAAVDVKNLTKKYLLPLLRAGIIVEESNLSPDVHFACVLEERPFDPRASYTLNPSLWLQRKERLPRAVERFAAHTAAVASAGPMLWVRDPVTRFVFPLHVSAHEARQLERLMRTGRVASIPQNLRGALVAARVLLDRTTIARERKRFDAQLVACKEELRERRYTVIRDVLPRLFLDAARRYLRAFDAAGGLHKTFDGQEELRDWRHNEQVSRFIHNQLARMLNRVLADKIKASYAYLVIYRRGARLKKHTDRPQCVWNLSLQIDSQPAVVKADAWPIYLEIAKRSHEVTLDVGDCVVYSGTDIPHWRPRLTRARSSTLCFFHFVPRRFRGSLE